jgi:hypothetical protein
VHLLDPGLDIDSMRSGDGEFVRVGTALAREAAGLRTGTRD